MSKLLTWYELLHLPVGTALVFPEPGYDIYPHCTVPAGTRAIMSGSDVENGIIDVLTADTEVCEALREWDGRVQFNPLNDGDIWTDESPVALEDSKTEKADA